MDMYDASHACVMDQVDPTRALFSHLRTTLTPHGVRGSSAHPSMPRTLLMGLEPVSRRWQIGALTVYGLLHRQTMPLVVVMPRAFCARQHVQCSATNKLA